MIGRIWQITWRELRAYFLSPIAYVILTAFLFVNGVIFIVIVDVFSQPGSPPGSVMQTYLAGNIFFWILIPPIIATITMRLFSEERRSGTLEVLMTAPVSDLEAVLGKYLAALAFYVALWAPTFLYIAILRAFSPLDVGPIISGYLFVLLLGAMFIALGVLVSILTRSQIIAAIVSFVLLLLLFLVPILFDQWLAGPGAAREFLRGAFSYMNTWYQARDFGKGIVDTRPLVYYITATALFLYLSVWSLAAKKGK